MTRHITTLLALTVLGSVLALGATNASAGGFNFGGGGGGGHHAGSMNAMRSAPSNGGNQFRGMMSGGTQHQPQMNQHLGQRAQAAGGPNVFKGAVQNPLLGQGTGANPRAILGNGAGPGVATGAGQQLGGGGPAVSGGPAIGGGRPGPAVKAGGAAVTSVAQPANLNAAILGKFRGPQNFGPQNFGQQNFGQQNFAQGKSDCQHVIGMLFNQCAYQQFKQRVPQHCSPPVFVQGGWFPGPGFGLPVAQPLGDLELVEVCLQTDACNDMGPLYQVTIRNNSTIAVDNFRVSIVAVLGTIDGNSPSVTVNVGQIAAGETGVVSVQLPGAVMSLGPTGQPAPFDTVVVAIDSFNELIENNELNNLLTLKRTDVKLIEVTTTVEAPVVSGGAPINPTDLPPAIGGDDSDEHAVSIEGPAVGPAPVTAGGIDIDSLDLGGDEEGDHDHEGHDDHAAQGQLPPGGPQGAPQVAPQGPPQGEPQPGAEQAPQVVPQQGPQFAPQGPQAPQPAPEQPLAE